MKKLLTIIGLAMLIAGCNESTEKTNNGSLDSTTVPMSPSDHKEAVRIADSATNALWDSTNRALDSMNKK